MFLFSHICPCSVVGFDDKKLHASCKRILRTHDRDPRCMVFMQQLVFLSQYSATSAVAISSGSAARFSKTTAAMLSERGSPRAQDSKSGTRHAVASAANCVKMAMRCHACRNFREEGMGSTCSSCAIQPVQVSACQLRRMMRSILLRLLCQGRHEFTHVLWMSGCAPAS